MALQPHQTQLMDELGALVSAWADRGLTYRDVVPAFAAYLVTTSIQGGYKITTIMELIPRLWAKTMLAIVEEKARASIPEPK